MSYEITGILIEKFDAVQVSEKFKKREFVIDTRGEYPQRVKFQLTNDKCGYIDNIQIGQAMKVVFDVRGRKWEKDGKAAYFTNLEAWKVTGEQQTGIIQPDEPQTIEPEEPSNDLPFILSVPIAIGLLLSAIPF